MATRRRGDWLWWVVPGVVTVAIAIAVVAQSIAGDEVGDRPVSAATEPDGVDREQPPLPAPSAPAPAGLVPRLLTGTVADLGDVFPVDLVVALSPAPAPTAADTPLASPIVISPRPADVLFDDVPEYSVGQSGTVEITVIGQDWTAAPPIFVLPCDVESLRGPLDTAGCDTANLTPGTPEAGTFEVSVTYEVPPEGLVVAAGDAAQTEIGAVLLTPDAVGPRTGSITVVGERTQRGASIEGSNFAPGLVDLSVCMAHDEPSCVEWWSATVVADIEGTFRASFVFDRAVPRHTRVVATQAGAAVTTPLDIDLPILLAASSTAGNVVEGHYFRPRSSISLTGCPFGVEQSGPECHHLTTVLVDAEGSFSITTDAEARSWVQAWDGDLLLTATQVQPC